VFAFLHGLPSGVLFVLVLAVTLLVTAGGYLLVRPTAQRLLEEESESDRVEYVGTFVQAVGTLYGLLVGLVAVAVWGDYKAAQDLTSREAAAMAAFYHDVSGLREPARTDLRARTAAYVNHTIDVAWPAQRRGENPPESHVMVRELRMRLQAYEPPTAGQTNLHAEALRKVNELVEFRRHRVELIEEALGGEMWAVVLVGTFATIALSWLMPSRSKRLHVTLEVLLGTFLGLSLFVILAFDRPLFGQVSVDARAYELVRDRTIATDPP
jgi:hypothetical protein